jgi:ubiquinone/menaquinone biosynthesis C-methylase UbiE
MNPDMVKYWNNQAKMHFAGGQLRDNIHKRPVLLHKITQENFYNKHILEIGVGIGGIFSALNIVYLGNFFYTGTDVSEIYCDFVRKRARLNMVHADVTKLPGKDNEYDYIVALDSLEHVPLDDRMDGYREIDRVMKPHGKIIMNIPVMPTQHEEFDDEFTYKDLMTLVDVCSLKIEFYERYKVYHPKVDGDYFYEFFIGAR